MLSKEQKIEKLKKIAQMADKINSVGNVFIAKKFDDVEEEIGSLTKIVTDYIESVPFPQDGIDGKDGSPDTGEDIVQKINALALDPDLKIDASHIKNLPINNGGSGIGGRPLFKLTTGANLTTAEVGAIEYNNTFHLTNSDATRRHVVLAPNTTKVTASAPYTNDGYIIINIGGTDFKVMTTA